MRFFGKSRYLSVDTASTRNLPEETFTNLLLEGAGMKHHFDSPLEFENSPTCYQSSSDISPASANSRRNVTSSAKKNSRRGILQKLQRSKKRLSKTAKSSYDAWESPRGDVEQYNHWISTGDTPSSVNSNTASKSKKFDQDTSPKTRFFFQDDGTPRSVTSKLSSPKNISPQSVTRSPISRLKVLSWSSESNITSPRKSASVTTSATSVGSLRTIDTNEFSRQKSSFRKSPKTKSPIAASSNDIESRCNVDARVEKVSEERGHISSSPLDNYLSVNNHQNGKPSSPQHLQDSAPIVKKEMPCDEDARRRILGAAKSLEIKGDSHYEKKEYEKAMSAYAHSLRLKKRTLAPSVANAIEVGSDFKCVMQEGQLQKLSGAEQSDLDGIMHIATRLNNIGFIQQQRKKLGQYSTEEEQNPAENAPYSDKESSLIKKNIIAEPKIAIKKAVIEKDVSERENLNEDDEEDGLNEIKKCPILEAYTQSLQMKRLTMGNNHTSVATTLNNIGSVHFSNCRYDKALEAYDESLRVMKMRLGDEHPDVATIFNNIGDVHYKVGNAHEAVTMYRKALTVRWSIFGQDDAKVTRLLEKIAYILFESEHRGEGGNRIGHDQEIAVFNGSFCSDCDDEDDPNIGEDELQQRVTSFQKDLVSLREELRGDIVKMNAVGNELAHDIVKEKLTLLRDFKKLAKGQVVSSP